MRYIVRDNKLQVMAEIDADRVQHYTTVSGLVRYWFFRRTGNWIFRRWLLVAQIEACNIHVIPEAAKSANDLEFLAKLKVKL